MHVHLWFYMWANPWKSVGNMYILCKVCHLFQLSSEIYFLSILKDKNNWSANSVQIQNKSPKSSGIMWDLHQSVQETAALCQCPWQEELRENPALKVGSQLGASLGWVCASSSWWEKAAGCAHSILCLRKILQQQISLLHCMKIKPSINFDARSASHSFSSLALKWHQQWTQTL